MRFLKLIGHILIITILTALTQIGGFVWIITIVLSKAKNWKKRYAFPLIYLVFNIIIVPPIASYFGRVQLPLFSNNLEPKNWFYPLAFRNYVTPELKEILLKSSQKSGIRITYLDANFPFYNGFPLLPHLSHNDGKKIDLSFMYLDKTGKATNKKPSFSGYGVFINSNNQTAKNCIDNVYWQYDFTKHLTFGTNKELTFDESSTKKLIQHLLSHSETQKIFIEPYLKSNLNLQDSRIRFHGCQAVRHDDHIHLQIK